MEHYHKAESRKYTTPPEPHEIRIGQGNQIKKVVAKALRYLADEEKRKVRLSGQGPTITKTVTCCEIVKRKVPTAHQITDICYTTIEDIWEPNDPEKELDKLKVTTRTPAIHILLSHEPLDPNTPGYQAPLHGPKRKKVPLYQRKSHEKSARSGEGECEVTREPECRKAGEESFGKASTTIDERSLRSGPHSRTPAHREQKRKRKGQQSSS